MTRFTIALLGVLLLLAAVVTVVAWKAPANASPAPSCSPTAASASLKLSPSACPSASPSASTRPSATPTPTPTVVPAAPSVGKAPPAPPVTGDGSAAGG